VTSTPASGADGATVAPPQLRIVVGPSLDAIPGLRAEAPDTQIVVLTMEDDPSLVREEQGWD
jgi:DNA-binding NarL/FixJ family response regulator